MQPMPAKNRTAIAVGAAVLAVLVGGFALWSANRSTEPAPQDQSQVEAYTDTEQSTMTPAPTGSVTDLTAPLTGTTSTETSAATTTTPTQVASVPETYVVQPGDTLSSIAAHFYGDSKYYGDIEAANHLEDPSSILPGTTLNLPKLETLKAAETEAVAPATAPATATTETETPATAPTATTPETPAN